MEQNYSLSKAATKIIFGAAFGLSAWAHAAPTTSTLPTPRPVTSMEEQRTHIGVRLGGANLESSFDNTMEFGAEYGYQPYIPFSVTFELSGYRSNRSDLPDLNRSKILAKGSYNFGGSVPVLKDSFVGAGLGPVMDMFGDTAYGRLGISVQAGFDIPLTNSGNLAAQTYSVGADARYLFVSDASPDDFNLNGVVKYWF